MPRNLATAGRADPLPGAAAERVSAPVRPVGV